MTTSPELAATFMANAASFLRGARDTAGIAPDHQLHAVSIAIELSTKAAILHAGGTDERNRRELRHDLVRACYAAEAIGFRPAPEVRRVAAQLSPYYSTHRLPELALAPAEAGAMLDAAEGHLAAVRAWIDRPACHGGNPL